MENSLQILDCAFRGKLHNDSHVLLKGVSYV